MPLTNMPRTKIKAALASSTPLESILIQGWVRTRRDAKDFSFLEVGDGSCLAGIQVVADSATGGYENIHAMGTGAAVGVEGALVASPGKGQRWEIKATRLILYGAADPETYPLQKKRHSDEFLRSLAYLRPRTNKYGAIFRIRSSLSLAIHEFFGSRGFVYLHTPILTSSDCEGAGDLFRVSSSEPDFFGKQAYLTVSGQLAAEPFALALSDVYTFGPTFRAEKSDTPRHAAEFWMVEPEMAFADLTADMDLAEAFCKHLANHALTHCRDDLELFSKFVDADVFPRLESFLARPFARVAYAEAIDILKSSNKKFEYPVNFGLDLQTEHERYLAEEHVQGPVIVYDYPKDIKAFYMRQNDDGATVAAMDLLVPRVGELIGGSQREERLDVLTARIQELGLPLEAYSWYLDTRRFGSAPHAGFGLGFERLLMLVTGVANIRDVIAYPRAYKQLEF